MITPVIINFFTGSLALTSLEWVTLYPDEGMQAIGALCPKLRKVSFSNSWAMDEDPNLDFQSILTRNWPKVSSFFLFVIVILLIYTFYSFRLRNLPF